MWQYRLQCKNMPFVCLFVNHVCFITMLYELPSWSCPPSLCNTTKGAFKGKISDGDDEKRNTNFHTCTFLNIKSNFLWPFRTRISHVTTLHWLGSRTMPKLQAHTATISFTKAILPASPWWCLWLTKIYCRRANFPGEDAAHGWREKTLKRFSSYEPKFGPSCCEADVSRIAQFQHSQSSLDLHGRKITHKIHPFIKQRQWLCSTEGHELLASVNLWRAQFNWSKPVPMRRRFSLLGWLICCWAWFWKVLTFAYCCHFDRRVVDFLLCLPVSK